MSKISMTPDQSVMWTVEGSERGIILLPEDPLPEIVKLLFNVDATNPSLELIGVGKRSTGAAKVYRLGDYALRVTEGTSDPNHGGLAWLSANVSLSVALSSYQSTDYLKSGIRTPVYLGAINGSNGSIVIMSYEGDGRGHAGSRVSNLVDRYCQEAISSTFPGLKIFTDPEPDNILVGKNDVVKLDVQPAIGFKF